MDYKFLTSKEFEKFFEETDLSIGEILRTIMSEKLTGIKIENRGRFQDITDEEWYGVLQKSFESTKQDPPVSDEELNNIVTKMFKDGEQ